MTSIGDSLVETSIKSPGFASDSLTTAFSLSAAISSVATSIGDLTSSTTFGASVTLVISLDETLLVSSAETCPSCAKAKRIATDANPTFILRNEKRSCLNIPFAIMTSFL